ncbi:MAG: PadR family transcriptional regulator [Thermoanaerobaculia bacterium]|nr:PadR family transcriptional regulator [Thermoanaerobaculia bacterium]
MNASTKLKPQWFQILLALADGKKHGQGIMAEVLRQSEGTMRLWPTSLYGSLKKLLDIGFLRESPLQEGSDGDRRRFYELTPAGKQALVAEVLRIQRTVNIAIRKSVLET